MFIEAQPGRQLLRVQVYDYLKQLLQTGVLEPNASIRVNTLVKELGISRTPLQQALLLLQDQGFVSILPQRGVKINVLTEEDIRNIYEILGGIESRVVLSVFHKLGKRELNKMKKLNSEIEVALARGDFVGHDQADMKFHDVFLNLSANSRLVRYVKTLKMQLYDLPKRNKGKQGHPINPNQHEKFVQCVQEGKVKEAADFLRDTHWTFIPSGSGSKIKAGNDFGQCVLTNLCE